MTHVVFSSESKTFLAKPQQEKAGIYKAKNEKKNTTHANHYFTHFSKFSHFLCRFSYKYRNQNIFVCFDFQNPTASKHEEISLQPTEVTGTLQPLSHTETIQSADFLESTEQHAAQIFLMSVLEEGSPLTDITATSGSQSMLHHMQSGCTACC